MGERGVSSTEGAVFSSAMLMVGISQVLRFVLGGGWLFTEEMLLGLAGGVGGATNAVPGFSLGVCGD